MGFFSWKTLDTDRSIANVYSKRNTFTVYMHDDKGNRWREDEYQGYGVFGGKDYYELLAEMNGVTCDYVGEEYTDYMRDKGIDIAFDDNPSGCYKEGVRYPNLVESFHWQYLNKCNESCEAQGYFL
jgi:hypothetical protein